MPSPVRTVICFVDQDVSYLNALELRLKPYQKRGEVELWTRLKLPPGESTSKHLAELRNAQVALVLVSPDLLASESFHTQELPELLQRARQKKVILLPVLIRPTNLNDHPLEKLQALPRSSKPIAEHASADAAWLEVLTELRPLLTGPSVPPPAGAGRSGASSSSSLQLHFVPAAPQQPERWNVELWKQGQHLATHAWKAPDPHPREYGRRLFQALFHPDYIPDTPGGGTPPHRLELTTPPEHWERSPLKTLPWARLALPSTGYPITDCGWTVLEPTQPPFPATFAGQVLVIEAEAQGTQHGPWTEALRSYLFTHVLNRTPASVLSSPVESLPEQVVWVVAASELDQDQQVSLQKLAVQAEATMLVWCVGNPPPVEGLAQVMLNVTQQTLPTPEQSSSMCSWLQRFLVNLRRKLAASVEHSFASACAGLSEEQRNGLRLRGAPTALTLESPDPRVALDHIFQWYLELNRSQQENRLNQVLERRLLTSRDERSILAVLVPGPRGSAPEAFTERRFRPLRDLSVFPLHCEWHPSPSEQLRALWRCRGTSSQADFLKSLHDLKSEQETLVLRVLHKPVALQGGTQRICRSPGELKYYLQCLRALATSLYEHDPQVKMLVMIPVELAPAEKLEGRELEKLSHSRFHVEVLEGLSLTVAEGEIRDWLKDYGVLPDDEQACDALLSRLTPLNYEQLVMALERYLPNLQR